MMNDAFDGVQARIVDLEQELRQNAMRRLEALADRLRLHSIRVTVSATWDFPAHEAIIRRARVIKADLIIASRHAGKHRLPWLLKLTDWELIRMSPVPVLLVKNSRPYRHPSVLAAIDPARANDKPQMLDRDILRTADKLAGALHGHLHAVHAYARYPLNVPPEALSSGMIVKLEEDAQHAAQKRFSRAIQPQHIARRRQHLLARLPAQAIAEAAAKSACAILVMGALSRSGIKRLLIGNTAEQVLDALTCDVLIVKPAAFRSRVPSASRGPRVQTVVNAPFVFV
jgi:universal stress protein E